MQCLGDNSLSRMNLGGKKKIKYLVSAGTETNQQTNTR